MAIIIPVEGPVQYVDGQPPIDEMRKQVQGWVTVFSLTTGPNEDYLGWVNEEGGCVFSTHDQYPRSAPLPLNPRASFLAGFDVLGTLVLVRAARPGEPQLPRCPACGSAYDGFCIECERAAMRIGSARAADTGLAYERDDRRTATPGEARRTPVTIPPENFVAPSDEHDASISEQREAEYRDERARWKAEEE